MLKTFLKNKIIISLIIICLFLGLAHYFGLSHFTSRYLTLLTNPIVRSAYYTSSNLSNLLSLYLSCSDLNQQNQELQTRLIQLSRENVELEELRDENQWLKNELNFLDDYAYRYQIARVIGRGPDYTDTYFLIDKGLSDGLHPGLAVTSQQGVLVGKIIKVEEHISHVQLLTSNQNKLSVMVAGAESVLGLISGEHNLNLKIDMLPKTAEIKLGDVVVTSGLNQFIPAGLLIGYLSGLENIKEKIWQQALVEPAIDYHQLILVTVIIPD